MKEFEQLVAALQESRKKCPWSKEQEMKAHLLELQNEVEEALQAIENNDSKNLQEELGDILMDAAFIAIVAEEKGLFKIKDMIDESTKKIKRRKPWVFGSEIITTKEEAASRWNEIKEQEKKIKE